MKASDRSVHLFQGVNYDKIRHAIGYPSNTGVIDDYRIRAWRLSRLIEVALYLKLGGSDPEH